MEEARLGLVVCPDHPGGGTVIIETNESPRFEFYIIRVVWKVGKVVSVYRYPPNHFAIAILATFEGKPFNILIQEEKCAECKGFDYPSFNR